MQMYNTTLELRNCKTKAYIIVMQWLLLLTPSANFALTDLVRSLSHELLGRLSPDRWYSDHPADIVINYPRGGLVRQLLQTVVLEESQSVRENFQSEHLLPIGCLDLNTFVQVLQREKEGKVDYVPSSIS